MTHDSATRERARELRSQGWSYERIGKRLGVSKFAAYCWLNPEAAQHGREQKRKNKSIQREKSQGYDASCTTCQAKLLEPSPSGLCGFCIDERELVA